MDATSASPRTGAGPHGTFKPDPQWDDAPRDVHVAFLLWLTAIAAGVAETVIHVIDALSASSNSGTSIMVSVAIRLAIYSVLVYVMTQMRLGKNWARLVLAVLLGVFGTLSLVIGPISWLAEGNSLGALLAGADLLFILVASTRALHLASVAAALVLMFRPAANSYFRSAAR